MLSKHHFIQRDQLEMITLDQLVRRTIWLVKFQINRDVLAYNDEAPPE